MVEGKRAHGRHHHQWSVGVRPSRFRPGPGDSLGLLGNAAQGLTNAGVTVNAATGNLLIQNTDEVLIGQGEDDVVARTYNSQGTYNDGFSTGWAASGSRSVAGLTGTVNTTSSTITRTDADGSQVVFTYNATLGAYVAKEGAGTDDTLSYNSTAHTWTWTDGSTQETQTYDATNGGRITQAKDTAGNTLTYSYNTSGHAEPGDHH